MVEIGEKKGFISPSLTSYKEKIYALLVRSKNFNLSPQIKRNVHLLDLSQSSSWTFYLAWRTMKGLRFYSIAKLTS